MTELSPSPDVYADELLSVTKEQVVTGNSAIRIAAMLDLSDCEWHGGAPLPVGWHFPLLGANTPRKELHADGFPGLGLPFPTIARCRLLAAGRTIETFQALRLGQQIRRTSRTLSIVSKTTTNGPLTIVKVEHVITDVGGATASLREQQTYMLVDTGYVAPDTQIAQSNTFSVIKTVTPDDTKLFQFSALSFNSHKIHLDRDYARAVEGYPDLVVNGGLTTLLMTEIARAEYGERIKRLTVRNAAPLFVNRPIQFVWGSPDGPKRILAFDNVGRLAAEMEFEIDGL